MSEQEPGPMRAPRQRRLSRNARALGPGLQMLFDEVVKEPVPSYWLALLQAADHRDQGEPEGRRARVAG